MGVVRKTKSVQTILDTFNESEEAISVVTLIERHKGQMNKTTIYRILGRLEQDGLLHSFLGHNGVKLFAKCNNCSSSRHHDIHPHFQCTECGKTECLRVELTVPQVAGHKIESVQVLYAGTCKDCIPS